MNDAQLPQAEDAIAAPSSQSLVLKNTFFLVVAQALGMPLSILMNAVMARHLGARDFGYIYLAGTMCWMGGLIVEGGQSGTLPSMIARDRSRSGELLGSGLASRAVWSPLVYLALAFTARMLGYGLGFQMVLGLTVLGGTISTVTGACTDAVLGFERTDVRAYSTLGQQLVTALLVVPTLLLGGGLQATLEAQVVASLLVCVAVWRSVRSAGVGTLRVRAAAMKQLATEGWPFLLMGLAIALQPNVDVMILAKLSTPQSIGYLAAARKLIGVLVFPAYSLGNALYPTLCRLHAEDMDGFRRNTSSALNTATVIVVPIALGCALYADVGISIFSRSAFGPAEDDLRVLSLFLLLLCFSMTLGTAIAAAGMQRQWALTQLGAVAVSAVIDPILIPWFAARTGNGSLGVCVSVVLSELYAVGAGLWLAPRGILNRALLRGIGLTLVAAVAMAGAARLLSGWSPYIAAPLALAAYVTCLWSIGGLDEEQMSTIRGILGRKFARFRT